MGGVVFFFFFHPACRDPARTDNKGQYSKKRTEPQTPGSSSGAPQGSPAVSHQCNSGSTEELREERILPLHPSNMENSKIDAALLKQVSIQL